MFFLSDSLRPLLVYSPPQSSQETLRATVEKKRHLFVMHDGSLLQKRRIVKRLHRLYTNVDVRVDRLFMRAETMRDLRENFQRQLLMTSCSEASSACFMYASCVSIKEVRDLLYTCCWRQPEKAATCVTAIHSGSLVISFTFLRTMRCLFVFNEREAIEQRKSSRSDINTAWHFERIRQHETNIQTSLSV